MARCRSCGAPIIWALTKSGKPMPVTRRDGGNVELEPVSDDPSDGFTARIVPDGCGAYVSHFATCPQAKRWRNPRD